MPCNGVCVDYRTSTKTYACTVMLVKGCNNQYDLDDETFQNCVNGLPLRQYQSIYDHLIVSYLDLFFHIK